MIYGREYLQDSNTEAELASLRKQLAEKCQVSEMNEVSKQQVEYYKR